MWGLTACQSGPLVPLGSSFVQIKNDKDNDEEDEEDEDDEEDDEDDEDCQSGPLGLPQPIGFSGIFLCPDRYLVHPPFLLSHQMAYVRTILSLTYSIYPGRLFQNT